MTWFIANMEGEEGKGFNNDNCLDLGTECMMVYALKELKHLWL